LENQVDLINLFIEIGELKEKLNQLSVSLNPHYDDVIRMKTIVDRIINDCKRNILVSSPVV
jgi:FtsZ-binding cell division protein ZapB